MFKVLICPSGLLSKKSFVLTYPIKILSSCHAFHSRAQENNPRNLHLSLQKTPTCLLSEHNAYPLLTLSRCIQTTESHQTYRSYPRDSFTDVPPTSTHVFSIKRNVPSLKKETRLSFLSIRSLLSTPRPYMIYGLGGLIPFMSAPYAMYLTDAYIPAFAHAQLVYGACILSFLGGVSWGDHLKRTEKASLHSLFYSILLPLVAWPAVLLYPHPASFVMMIGGITYAGMKDVRTKSYPAWFHNLRFLLTTLVALSLSTTLVFSFTKEEKEDNCQDSDAC